MKNIFRLVCFAGVFAATVALAADPAMPPVPAGLYVGVIQEISDPGAKTLSEVVVPATFEISASGDLVFSGGQKEKTSFSWNGVSWVWRADDSHTTLATPRVVGEVLVIEYCAMEKTTVVGRAIFYLHIKR